MRKMVILLLAIATMFVQDAFAQKTPPTAEQKSAAKARREQLMQTRLELLKTELNLTDVQLEKFAPLYKNYRSEIHKVTSMNKEARIKKDQITNENALRVLSARLANNILTSTVKERYLLIFAEVIEPLQIMKLYRIDEKVSREASKLLKAREATAK